MGVDGVPGSVGLTHGVVGRLPVDVVQELLQEGRVVLQGLQVFAVVPGGENRGHKHTRFVAQRKITKWNCPVFVLVLAQGDGGPYLAPSAIDFLHRHTVSLLVCTRRKN